jgi:hypothetical protein
VSDFTARTILPNSETDLTFNIVPNVLGIATDLINQINNGASGITSATLNGVANLGGQQYQVNVVLV